MPFIVHLHLGIDKSYIIPMTLDIKYFLQRVENIIRNRFIPSICDGRACNDNERQLVTTYYQ